MRSTVIEYIVHNYTHAKLWLDIKNSLVFDCSMLHLYSIPQNVSSPVNPRGICYPPIFAQEIVVYN